MPTELITIVTTLATAAATAVIAGVISYVAARGTKNHEWRLQLIRERIGARETLYARFLTLAASHALQAIDAKVSTAASFSEITQQVEHMSMLSSPPVVNAARLIWQAVLSMNTATRDGDEHSFYELKEAFIREARAELISLEARI